MNSVSPPSHVLHEALKQSFLVNKPLHLDYYKDSFNNKTFLGKIMETNTYILVKSPQEYTSEIYKIYKYLEYYILFTKESVYIVPTSIPKQKLTSTDYCPKGHTESITPTAPPFDPPQNAEGESEDPTNESPTTCGKEAP